MSLLLAAGAAGFTSTGALTVVGLTVSGTGTEQDQFTSTGALTVPQLVIAGTGTLTVNITGTGALTVPQPVIAGTGTVTVNIAGSGALTVPVLAIAGTGTEQDKFTSAGALTVTGLTISGTGTIPSTAPPAVGGRPHRKAVVHRYPPKRVRTELPDFHVNDLHEGSAALGVPSPRIRGRGTVQSVVEAHAEEQVIMQLAFEDADMAFAIMLADTWLN